MTTHNVVRNKLGWWLFFRGWKRLGWAVIRVTSAVKR